MKSLWFFLEILETVFVAVLAVFIIRAFLFQPFLVSGASMEPNFSSGDYLLVDELSYRFRPPERGEVVVFEPPAGGNFFIKRIIGLPNERIKIQGNRIFIFNQRGEEIVLSENYLSDYARTFGEMETILEEGQYFVLGDNRNYSFDSRAWGSLTRDRIIGLVKLRLWPLTAIATFGRPSY